MPGAARRCNDAGERRTTSTRASQADLYLGAGAASAGLELSNADPADRAEHSTEDDRVGESSTSDKRRDDRAATRGETCPNRRHLRTVRKRPLRPVRHRISLTRFARPGSSALLPRRGTSRVRRHCRLARSGCWRVLVEAVCGWIPTRRAVPRAALETTAALGYGLRAGDVSGSSP